jgi:hypothetical protein
LSPSSRMVHRAAIERDDNAGEQDADNPGYSAPADYGEHLPAQRCRLWAEAVDEQESPAGVSTVAMWRMIVPLSADVVETDRITSVVDRRGRVLWPNRPYDEAEPPTLDIEAVIPRVAHKLLLLGESR